MKQWSAEHNTYIDLDDVSASTSLPSRRALIVRAVAFVFIFALFQQGWEALRDSPIEYAVIHDATVRPAAFFIQLISPSIQVQAIKFSLRASGGGLNLLNGCEGMEALFLLVSAFIVAPISYRSRFLGLLVGIPIVFIINQARVLLLFYAYRNSHEWFDLLHGTVTPIVVILLVCAYFYSWLVRAAHNTSSTA